MASLADRARDKLQPALYADIANGGILDAYLSGLVYPLQEVEDYAADSDDGPGWSIVLDLSRAPDKLMPWLSQFVGVDATIPSGQTPDQIRQAITDRPNWKRGTPAAMAAAAQLYLTGSKIVVFRERDTSPYHFTVMTYANETRRFNGGTAAATLSGDLITDAVRAVNTSGDGRGYTAVTNIMPNGDFEVNTAGWVPINGVLTRVSEDKQFGSWSAKMVASGGGAQTYMYWVNLVTGAPIPRSTYTISAWVKGVGSAIGKAAQLQINEAGGAVGAQASFYTPFTLDGTWQKIVATGTLIQADRTSLILYFFTINSVAAAGETVYIDGVQVEQGSVAHDFVSTNGAVATAMQGAPDSSIGNWEATTNLIPNGGFEANTTGWTGFNVTLSRDISRSKFGTASMRSIVTVAALAEHGYCSVTGLVVGQPYTLSGWVWIPSSWTGSNVVSLQFANAGNPAGFFVYANMALRDQWQRVSATFIATATTGNPAWRASAAPSVGQELWFDGVQLENKNLPTPYVDTSAATASRVAGRIQLPASLLSPVQGWVAMRLRMGWPSTADAYSNAAFRLFWWGDSANDRLLAYYRVTNDTFGMQSAVGGVLVETAVAAPAFAAGDKKTVIFAWTANTISVSLDGSNFVTFSRPSGGAIALSTFDLGTENGVLNADCDYLWAAGGIGALTNADVATLAAIGDTDPDIPSLPVNGIPTFTWKANDANYILPVTDTRVIEAINAVKPAGLQFSYSVLSGQDYTALLANHPLYSNVFTDYTTYHGVVIDRPGT